MKSETLLVHLESSIKTFESSPPSTRYQEGYLAALRELLEDYMLATRPMSVRVH